MMAFDEKTLRRIAQQLTPNPGVEAQEMNQTVRKQPISADTGAIKSKMHSFISGQEGRNRLQ